MTNPAAAPAQAGSELPAVPALNTPEGMAARKNTHPAMRGEVQPGTQVPQPPAPPSTQVPQAPPSVAPQVPQQQVAPQASAAAPTPAPDTNLLAAVAPPALQYAQPDPPTPPDDPRIASMQQELAEQKAARQQAEADAARQRLLNPTINYESVGDVAPDQVQAIQQVVVQPQIEAIYTHFDAEMKAQAQRHQQELERLRGVGAQVAEVQHQQTVAQNNNIQQLNQTILSKHPTFVQDFNDPAFVQAAGTYHTELSQAYHAGNAAQVIAVMDYVKGKMTPPPTGVEGSIVGGATATMSPAPDHETQQVKQSDIRANVEAFQRGQIDRATYMQNAANYEAARKANMVIAG